MAHFSTPLFSYLLEKPSGSCSTFEPDYLYLTRFPRFWSSPILGFSLRAPCGEGTVIVTIVSDEKGQPNEVLFKTELPLPSGDTDQGSTTLITICPEPINGQDIVWLGVRFSKAVQVPTRMDVFNGLRTAGAVDFARISGSLRNMAMDTLTNDTKLGLPLLFPVFGAEYGEVPHGE